MYMSKGKGARASLPFLCFEKTTIYFIHITSISLVNNWIIQHKIVPL